MKTRRHSLRSPLVVAGFLVVAGAAVWAGWTALGAQDGPPPAPRVNLATWYTVDPNWPQPPDGVAWGAMPGAVVDRQGHVWLFTRANPPVQVYDASGKYLRGWGDEHVGSAHFMRLDGKGNVWLADMKDHVVMQFTPEGKLIKTLGTRGEPGCDATHFDRPTDMAIAPDGHVFVSDGYGNRRIAHFDADGRFVKAWGSDGTGPGQFSLPHSIVIDSRGRLYVADRSNVRIQVFDREGKLLAQWPDLLVPWGLAITKDDEIWACGSSPMIWGEGPDLLGCPPKDQLVMRLDTAGRVLQLWTFPKGEDGREQPGELNWLHCIALDAKGNLYLGDIKGARLQRFVRHQDPAARR